jgi:hypothetical protein
MPSKDFGRPEFEGHVHRLKLAIWLPALAEQTRAKNASGSEKELQ